MTGPDRPVARPTFVSFDITGDARREELRRELRRHGDWIQRSLWVAIGTSGAFPGELAAWIAALVAPADRTIVHRPCLGCLSALAWLPSTDLPLPTREPARVEP